MNIKRAKEEIKNCIEAYLLKDERGEYLLPAVRQRPLLLIGPPGIGKTQIMEQVARESGVGLVAYTITHHTRQSAIGLPLISEKRYGGAVHAVTEYTMSEIVASVYDRIEETGLKEGILFIDEINCVSETLAPTMLQFLQGKTFGNHRIPAGWIIVTAGNPPEYNKSVREFDIATLDRIRRIEVEADFKVWKEYAVQTAVHPAVIAYLEARPEHFYRIETTADGKLFATPRGWEDLARFLEIYEKIGKTVDRDVVYQYIEHPRIAKDFANYLELYYKYQSDYQIEQILAGNISEDLLRKVSAAAFDEKFSVISLILAHLNGRFRQLYLKERYLERLLEELKKLNGMERPGAPEQSETMERPGRSEQPGRPEAPEQAKASEQPETMAAALAGLAASLEKERSARRTAGLLDRTDDYIWRDVAESLENYGKRLWTQKREPEAEHEQEDRPVRAAGAADGMRQVRGFFGEESGAFERQSDEAGAMLEHAFDFMEAAFGDSQEMVLFITELNTNYYSVHFLKENSCERYYLYNKSLLFEDREDEIRKRLEGLR